MNRNASALFPLLQGASVLDVTAARAALFKAAASPALRSLMEVVVTNAKSLAVAFQRHGVPVFTGGTDAAEMNVLARLIVNDRPERVRARVGELTTAFPP